MKEFFDKKFIIFLFIGVINTLFSAAVMFLLYNQAGFGYWGSSAVSYIMASILSFFLNRNFTFHSKEAIVNTALKFTINIAVCYIVAYAVAKPLALQIFQYFNTDLSESIKEQLAMLLGMVLFTAANYIGQRYFVFPKRIKQKNNFRN